MFFCRAHPRMDPDERMTEMVRRVVMMPSNLRDGFA